MADRRQRIGSIRDDLDDQDLQRQGGEQEGCALQSQLAERAQAAAGQRDGEQAEQGGEPQQHLLHLSADAAFRSIANR